MFGLVTGRSRWVDGRSRVPAVRLAASASLLVALVGCTAPADTIDDAVDQGVAATATASLALSLDDEGRMFRTTTRTTVSDARRELVDSERTAAQVDASTAVDAGRRTEAMDALHDAVLAADAAVDALSGVGDLGEAAERVAEAEEALRALTREGAP